VSAKIARVGCLKEKTPAISPATFADLNTTADFREFADHVRELTGDIPIGFKLSANHIEEDTDFVLEASADYIILDSRGGGTGAAPTLGESEHFVSQSTSPRINQRFPKAFYFFSFNSMIKPP